MSVRPSVRPSDTLQYSDETAKHNIKIYHHRVATLFSFFSTKRYNHITYGKPPTLNGGVECKENEKNRDFRPIYRFISKPIQDDTIKPYLLWKANKKPYSIFRMVLFPINLSDP